MFVKISVAAPALAVALLSQPAAAQPSRDDDDRRPQTALELAKELGISADDQRPESQRSINLFGKPLILGGEIGASFQYRKDYELTDGADDDDFKIGPEAKLEATWQLGDTTVAFFDAKLFADTTLYKEGGKSSGEAGVSLSEAWLLKTRLFGTNLALQTGRQQIQDRREWWWDENLDATRLHYFGKKVTAFVGVGRELSHHSTLGRLDPEERGILRVLGNAKWEWADRQELGLFFLNHNDQSRRYAVNDVIRKDRVDDADARLTWAGIRGRGRIKSKVLGKTYYWFDLARVSGKQLDYDLSALNSTSDVVTSTSRRKIRGWAYDLGASIELPFKFKPYLTLGYAKGSGDKRRGGRDTRFRQTGLHNNNGKFRGLSRFRYYGEVLRPELSNIAISTVALGVPVKEDRWIEGIWHRYRQPVADDRIPGSRLDIEPTGLSRKIGDEFDLVMSHRPNAAWEIEFTGGGFRAGEAFGPEKGNWAWLAQFKVDYNF
jgi:alginate production protein